MRQRLIIPLAMLMLLLAACSPSSLPASTSEAQVAAQQPSDTPIPTEVSPTYTPVPEPTEAAPTPTSVVSEAKGPTDTPALPPTPEVVACDGTPTSAQAEGPYYTPNTPERANLVEAGMGGTPLLVTGRVLNQACEPIFGAKLDFWQTDDSGEYDNVGYRMRGHQFTDENGNYALETILPGVYPGRPPHIHVKVNAPDGPVLTTQIYFEGQPGNESDGLVQPSLIVPLIDAADGGKAATFNFVLVSEQATPLLQEYPVPSGSRPHDVAPAPDGSIWYTAQGSGELGRLDPATGETRHIGRYPDPIISSQVSTIW